LPEGEEIEMRMLIMTGLMAATLVPAMATAQSGAELRHDGRDIREERQDVRDARRQGASPAEVRDQRRDIADARREYRGDWRDYRRAHPDVYRGPGYAGPRGYRYRPVDVGYRFQPTYYDRRYWVDPVRYRLRPVVGPQRWVRYGNDVVLVDTRTGGVVEVNRGFFY
jgi:Ni/Co efflux regulator RcnB